MCTFRKPQICLPESDDSLSDSNDDETNKCVRRTLYQDHRAKVVRKSRKSRQLKAFSVYNKQASVGVQTEANDVMTFRPQQLQPVHNNRMMSSSTQTDDVIVISVSQQLHASSDVSDGLFSFGHSGLLPAIRVSDVHSLGYVRETDSGHMSDADNKLLTAAESTDHDYERPNKDTVLHKPLTVVSVYRGSEALNGTTAVQDVPPLAGCDGWQQNKAAAMQNRTLAVMSQKRSSTEGGHQLSRWTTATRLDVLEKNGKGRISARPETFFASLETSDHQQTALNDVDVSGISVLSSHRGSNLPLPSLRILSVNSQTTSSAANVDLSNSSVLQSSAGTPCQVKKVSRQSCSKTHSSNSSSGGVSRPSTGTHRHISKGSRQSRGKPRLSVGRKSLPRCQPAAVRDKYQLSTKISRPAAWLMSAAKSSRSKVPVE